jgi:hypothetical protein
MNWVWANSPTSGNERLGQLAPADACSRDDGTGCWPSAATIARKANVSDRTARRVIARLEADGHVTVHRGGGRCGSTNSYTVATDIRSPGQSVTLPGWHKVGWDHVERMRAEVAPLTADRLIVDAMDPCCGQPLPRAVLHREVITRQVSRGGPRTPSATTCS